MFTGVPPPPGADLAEAFLGAILSAMESNCQCEGCQILRAASITWRERLKTRR